MTAKSGGGGQAGAHLDRIARGVHFAHGFNARLAEMRAQALLRYAKGRSALEIGCADGVMTPYWARRFQEVTAVDGSALQCRRLRRTLKARHVEVVHSLFERLRLERRYDTVLLCHVLEHVAGPAALLRRAHEWLAPGGRLLVDVPNADSLHRRLGVKMGLLRRTTALGPADRVAGHRRVYTQAALRRVLARTGWRIVAEGGVFLKLLPDAQMVRSFSPAQIRGLEALGADFPAWCAEIYAVAVPS